MMNRYWQAVRTVFSAEWTDRTNFILLQTIGLSGFAQLGATLMDQGCSDGKVAQADFELYLQAVKKEVDLSRGAEQWKGVAGAGGANRVAEVLIKAATKDNATKIKIIEDLTPEVADAANQLD